MNTILSAIEDFYSLEGDYFLRKCSDVNFFLPKKNDFIYKKTFFYSLEGHFLDETT